MEEKILCPWCGSEMEMKTVHHDVPGIIYARGAKKREQRWNAWTSCTNDDCGADGPIVAELESEQEAIDAAIAAALRRYTPPIKPMTFGEILGKEVELEIRYNCKTKRVIVPYHLDETIEVLWENSFITGEDKRHLSKSMYGKTWRCWERNPTDEERSAAEWET